MRLFTLFIFITSCHSFKFSDCSIKPKELSKIHQIGEKIYSHELDFFFSPGLQYNPVYAFTDVFLQINLTDSDSYHFYQGQNCSMVQEKYENDNKYFGLLKNAAILRSHQLSPFNDTIIGVSTSKPYEISVVIWTFNYIRIVAYISAIILFLLAGSLVRNVVFYYTSGCSFGLLASLLLVAFIVWRVAPKKTIGLPILIGGWSVSLYMLHFAWANLQSILIDYQKYVIGYFTSVFLISLAVCYKKGPPTDERSHDIAQWTLQLVALLIIYFSTQVVEFSIGTIAVLIAQQFLRGFLLSPIRWYFVGLKTFWRKMFPKSRRLLTDEEYEEQGRKTTQRELELLREYCRKEGNRAWKLVGKVRDASRLASFIDGENEHVTEEEAYEHDITGDVLESYDDDDYYNENASRIPSGFSAEDYEDDEWDEILVSRGPSRNYGRSGPSSVQSIRLPRSIARKLFSPCANENMNHTFNGRPGESSSFRATNRMGTNLAGNRYQGAMSDMRPIRKQDQAPRRKFDEKELNQFRAQMLERKEQMMKEEEDRRNQMLLETRCSTSASSIASEYSSARSQLKKKIVKTSNKRTPRRAFHHGSDSEEGVES